MYDELNWAHEKTRWPTPESEAHVYASTADRYWRKLNNK